MDFVTIYALDTIRLRLGRNVQSCRKAAGLSQEELAEAIDLSKGSIGLLENGKVWPEFDNLCLIAQALNVDVDDFFGSEVRVLKPTLAEALKVVEEKTGIKMTIPEKSPAPKSKYQYLIDALERADSATAKETVKTVRDMLSEFIYQPVDNRDKPKE